MQSLTASPRDAYTEDQITALLQAPDFEMLPGLELLDANENLVEDLSDYLESSGSSISRDCNAVIHGTCTLMLSYELNWGTDRVRPYVLCSSKIVGLTNVRFNLGIYIVTSPSVTLGERDYAGNLITQYTVNGYDKLYFLQLPVGDSVIAPQGGDVLLQVTNLINEATNSDPKISLDTSATGTLLAHDMTWPLTGTPSTYLDIINKLLKAINYMPLWVDQDGYFTSVPAQDPSTLSPEWDFVVQDAETNLIADPRVRTQDTWGVPNWWRFIQNGLTTAPTEGIGQFTYQDNDSPITGFAARGYLVKKVVFLDAVNQQTLNNLGAQQVIIDTNVPESWSCPSGPLPQSGHFDIVNYVDADIDDGMTSRKTQVQSWTMPLDGSEMARVMNSVLVVST